MAKKETVANTMKMLDSFLGQFRKTAEESNTETEDIKALETSDDVTDTQTNLGEEQAAAAADSGSTVDSTPANSDAAADPTYPESLPSMSTDEKIEETSEVLGEVAKTTQGEETALSKQARAEKLGNALLSVITSTFEKTAAAKKPLTREEVVLQQMVQKSAAAAQDYYESHLLGQIQRLQDEQDLAQARLHPTVLKQFGGVSGLLNKVAEEMPEAVLPEGMAELPPEVAAEVAAPAEVPEEVMTEAPAEAAPAEGEVTESDIEQLAGALEEAGVTPEDLEQAFQDVQQLQEAGVTPDELAAAVEEMNTEAPAEVPAEVPAEAAPAEVPVGEEKTAFDRSRIEAIKKFLRG